MNNTRQTCEVCKKEINKVLFAKKNTKYCSNACRQKAYRSKNQLTQKAKTITLVDNINRDITQANMLILELKERLNKTLIEIENIKKSLNKKANKD